MANFCVKASGSNTAPYDTWAKAAPLLETVLNVPPAAGDTVWVDSALAEASATALTLTVPVGVRVISTSDTTNVPATTYNVGAVVGTNTSSSLTINNNGAVYGVSFKAGTSTSNVVGSINTTDNTSGYFEDCTFQIVATGSTSAWKIGSGTAATSRSRVRTRNCNWIFGAVGQGITMQIGHLISEGDTFAPSGSVPTNLFEGGSNNCFGSTIELISPNLASCSGTLFAQTGSAGGYYTARISNAKLHASATLAPTFVSGASGEITYFDCNSGDVQYALAHFNYYGSTIASATSGRPLQVANAYVTAGATFDGSTHYAWEIATTANASLGAPYFSPWINRRVDASVGNAITPRLEIARLDSSTALNTDQVWANFLTKSNSGFPLGTIVTTRPAPATGGSAIATGVGTSAWTGSALWSGKLAPGSTVTPAEIGYMRARVVMAVASQTIYLDPQIYVA